jgi:hypothetical protein
LKGLLFLLVIVISGCTSICRDFTRSVRTFGGPFGAAEISEYTCHSTEPIKRKPEKVKEKTL